MKFSRYYILPLIFFLCLFNSNEKVHASLSFTELIERGISSEEIKKQVEFRTTFGLNNSLQKLLEVSNLSTNHEYQIPLTEEELIDLREREKFAALYAPIIIQELRGENNNSNKGTFYKDNKNGGLLVVNLLKDNLFDNENIIESLKNKIPAEAFNKIEFNIVDYSEQQLDDIVNKISNDRFYLEENGVPFTFVTSNIKENKIQVGIFPYTTEAANFLKEIYGDDLIQVVEEEEAVGESRTKNYYYMYGGLQIAPTSTNSTGTTGYCTNGFSLTTERGYFVVTAGHCTRGRSSFYQGGYYKGSVYSTSEGGYADVGVIRLDQNRTTNGIYRESYNDRQLTSYQYVNSDYVGQLVAQIGATTNVSAGEIESRNWSGNVETRGQKFYYQYLRDASYYSDGGDSGGTVYWGNELRGIHTAANGKFSHVHYILSKVPGTPKIN
ncbi:S1 family peptidase [Bacillus pinisoli]|uniref:S1 family peptidase n=1 Tax=Bacillus pinisoli TaxID=2901866 RepID=UPI001FF413A9|nr:S1 family peptidase [Bacillus pinisoli]